MTGQDTDREIRGRDLRVSLFFLPGIPFIRGGGKPGLASRSFAEAENRAGRPVHSRRRKTGPGVLNVAGKPASRS